MPRTISCLELALNLASQGLQVMWVDHHVEISEIIRSVDSEDERVKRVYRANGQERVAMRSGGVIFFVPQRGHGNRGLQADALFVSGEIYRDSARLSELVASLAASNFTRVGGEPFVTVLPERVRVDVA